MQNENGRYLHKHDEMHCLGCMGNVAHILPSLKTIISMSLCIMIIIMVTKSSLFVGIHTWETMRIIVDSFTIRNNDWHNETNHHHSLASTSAPDRLQKSTEGKSCVQFLLLALQQQSGAPLLADQNKAQDMEEGRRKYHSVGCSFIIYGSGQTVCENCKFWNVRIVNCAHTFSLYAISALCSHMNIYFQFLSILYLCV